MEPPLHRVATTPRTRMSILYQVQILLLLRGPVRTRFLSTPLTYPRPQPQSPILLPLQMNVAKRHQGGNLINGPGPIQVWNLRLPVRMKMVLSQQFHLCEAQKLILSDCKSLFYIYLRNAENSFDSHHHSFAFRTFFLDTHPLPGFPIGASSPSLCFECVGPFIRLPLPPCCSFILDCIPVVSTSVAYRLPGISCLR